jgi:hypothetical protein
MTTAGQGRCADCKHWRPFVPRPATPYDPEPHYWRSADRRRLGLCAGIGQETEGCDESPPNAERAQCTDLSDMAAFRTAATFGCVLWEPKP